ncbi:phospholipase A2 inhibitor and Ly6/PLAUR domain-containing protein-like [Spea bombifrons]|uniref:phospholipase A2 inhibitor and Ly6/PLAUR domain-containing protein-like n=1 Tax=Spea bombifrons TaxID=233779 RepID=UPI0023493C5D|nr:phospholipase A2 inhibitor and Ly6/PLAUR domain-containing protein-like [Spea bombifrons]
MESFLLFTCVLSVLVSPGYSLSCVHCISDGVFPCEGEEKRCPSDSYACVSTLTTSIIDGAVKKTFSRSCEKRSSCGIEGTIGFQKGKIKIAKSCCYTEGCTPSLPTLPGDSAQRAGLTCRSCTSSDSTWCYTSDTIECIGEEKRCILQATTTSGPKYSKSAVRGCATKNLCDIGSQYLDYGNGIKVYKEVTCTSAGISLRLDFILLTLTALLSSKLML